MLIIRFDLWPSPQDANTMQPLEYLQHQNMYTSILRGKLSSAVSIHEHCCSRKCDQCGWWNIQWSLWRSSHLHTLENICLIRQLDSLTMIVMTLPPRTKQSTVDRLMLMFEAIKAYLFLLVCWALKSYEEPPKFLASSEFSNGYVHGIHFLQIRAPARVWAEVWWAFSLEGELQDWLHS